MDLITALSNLRPSLHLYDLSFGESVAIELARAAHPKVIAAATATPDGERVHAVGAHVAEGH
jgi:hypothetical protein